jgi:hypothetical protein
MADRFTVFPFWSTRAKSGAVSPTAKLSADDDDTDIGLAVLLGANAVAEPTNMTERTAETNFMVSFF